MTNSTNRKLASIVAADVVGYSAMMADDEIGTLNSMRALKKELIEPIVAKRGGHIVKTMGDGFLIDFSSAVASIEAAVELQQKLRAQNANDALTKSINMRVGVHIGDIVIEDGDIFGDGVNIAARIEPLASPGGISVSDEAYRQIVGKIDVEWIDGGEHNVKNILRPVRIWHWGGGPVPSKKIFAADLSVPDLPSIAVLPFDNMSADPEQDYFADGLTEDLITDLSKLSGVFVVARNSTFAYKGQALDIPSVGRALGVANVIEGSVRKLGDRVRINVQLIDAKTGGHLWAERYDGSLDSVFELQDQVCEEVVSKLSIRLTNSEEKRLHDVHTHNLEAYELFVRAKAMPFPPIPPRILAAKELFEQVVEQAPEFAGGYAGLSWIVSFGALWGHTDPEMLGARAEALAYKAIALDSNFGWSYTILGVALLAQRRFDEAIDAAMKGLELLPSDPDAHIFVAVINGMRGKSAESIAAAEAAYRISPNFVSGPYLNVISHANFMAGDYKASLAAYEKNIQRGGPVGPPALCWAAASYFLLDELKASKETVKRLKTDFPDFRLEGWNFLQLVEDEEARKRLESAFLQAGIPS